MFTFFGAMVLHPDIQRQAQNELDSVLGQDRMPTFEDRSSLPFIDCIVLEVLRLNVVTPLGIRYITRISFWIAHRDPGIPHTVIEEDAYLDYRIPKGSLVLGNTWYVLLHDLSFGLI